MSDFNSDFDEIGSDDSNSSSGEESSTGDDQQASSSDGSRAVPIGKSKPVQYSGKRPFYGREEFWDEFVTFTMEVEMLLNKQYSISNTKKTGLHEAFIDVATDAVDPEDVATRLVELRGYDPEDN